MVFLSWNNDGSTLNADWLASFVIFQGWGSVHTSIPKGTIFLCMVKELNMVQKVRFLDVFGFKQPFLCKMSKLRSKC